MAPDSRVMCGRFLNKLPAAEIAHIFGNGRCSPCASIPRPRRARSTRSAGGLVPHWAKDLKSGLRMINARAEGVAILPAFRDAFKARRCIILASGFYEWVQTGAAKQPYAIVPEGDPLFAFAGLWENWRDRAGGRDCRSAPPAR
jgi:putative SOS response-associated peptidase YedK